MTSSQAASLSYFFLFIIISLNSLRLFISYSIIVMSTELLISHHLHTSIQTQLYLFFLCFLSFSNTKYSKFISWKFPFYSEFTDFSSHSFCVTFFLSFFFQFLLLQRLFLSLLNFNCYCLSDWKSLIIKQIWIPRNYNFFSPPFSPPFFLHSFFLLLLLFFLFSSLSMITYRILFFFFFFLTLLYKQES